jgi:methylated-DNA-[protein]-cysteine S-methyltransferase
MTTITRTRPRMQTDVDSPVGPLRLVATGGTLTGLRFQQQHREPPREGDGTPDAGPFAEVVAQLEAYFAGTLTEFDLPLELEGTAFQRRVWQALREIPYGQTRSYGQLAAGIGAPGASRAVGLANGRNPISIIVPCHRVIGADGTLTGFGGGLERKRALLDHEQRHLGTRLF